MPSHDWVYRFRVERVVDGDTVRAFIDQGMNGYRATAIRFYGIDAPETRGETREAGLAAKAWLEGWITRGQAGGDPWPFRIRTHKDPDSFGRYLGDIYDVATGECVNDALVAAGHAVYKEY